MTLHRLLPLIGLILVNCESDPGKDSENPGLFVLIDSSRAPDRSRLVLEARLDSQSIPVVLMRGISVIPQEEFLLFVDTLQITDPDPWMKVSPSTTISICNPELRCVELNFADSLRISGDLPRTESPETIRQTWNQKANGSQALVDRLYRAHLIASSWGTHWSICATTWEEK